MIGARLRGAAAAAAVATGLFATLVGLRAAEGEHGLTLLLRPWPTLALVAGVFLARLAWRLPWPATPALPAQARLLLAPALLALAVSLPFWAGRYAIDTGTVVLIYVMLGWGLNIVVGLAGLLDLGYVAFYAVGAYSYAILSTRFGIGFWLCLPISGGLAALWGILLGFPVLRLRGDYLAIVTLGFGEIIRIVLNNFASLTQGPRGIADIPRPTLFGLNVAGNGPGSVAGLLGLHATPIWRVVFLYYLILAMALLTNAVARRLRRLPLGQAWEALREDEIGCRALGINVTVTKLSAFAIGAMFAGFAGCFFAARSAFVSPESFVFMESATVLAIVVLGGMGSQLGTALAALIMVGGGEALREGLLDVAQSPRFAWAGSVASGIGQYRMLVFGLAMVAMMVFRPRGLISQRQPSVTLPRG